MGLLVHGGGQRLDDLKEFPDLRAGIVGVGVGGDHADSVLPLPFNV
jgi:hypothetical protein